MQKPLDMSVICGARTRNQTADDNNKNRKGWGSESQSEAACTHDRLPDEISGWSFVSLNETNWVITEFCTKKSHFYDHVTSKFPPVPRIG
jgi:hypothetical protein